MSSARTAHLSHVSLLVLARACCLARMARGPPPTATATPIVVRGVARGEEGGEWGPTLGRCAGV